MKWYSVKKYIPPYDSWIICRLQHKDGWEEYITAKYISCKEWDYGVFSKTCEDKENEFKITHFCIPDPIEIAEL